jgi:hypothetical protein
MSKLQILTNPKTVRDTDDTKESGMTTERWLAVYLLGALAFLAVSRRAFSDFIPR